MRDSTIIAILVLAVVGCIVWIYFSAKSCEERADADCRKHELTFLECEGLKSSRCFIRSE